MLVALCVLALAGAAWGSSPAAVKLLDLGDRDAVVISVDGEALVSDLVVHKLRPSRLEALYRYDGALPQVGSLSGDLIQGVALSPRPEGFMLTLTLADDLPTDGEQVYRETIVGSGATALEVFNSSSARTPFNADWLAGAPAPAVELTPAAGMVEPAAPVAAAPADFSGVSFDRGNLTLTIRGAAGAYDVKEQSFPPRVDVTLPGASGASEVVHKDLAGKVTFVEVTGAKSGSGMVVRASMSPNTSLVGQQVQGNDLVLTFGAKGAAVPAAQPLVAPRNTPVFEQPRMMPEPAPTVDTFQAPAAAPAGMALGDALSSAAGSEGFTPVGLGGAPQQVPSVEQILSMAQADAKRYGKNASSRKDAYGTYELPAFEGASEQLSDVRVNLNAASGFDVYAFLMYLSSISGISIIIDPYVDQPPTGATRPPRGSGFQPGGGDSGAGFRPGNVFDPQLGGSGFVIGQFNDIPFDQALNLVLETQNLRKVVYKNPNDPYAKPVILITNKERIEQELKGQNEIDLYQLHYADPNQLYNILRQLNLLPGVQVGWYIYSGSGGNQGGQGGQGGGNQGGGNRGGNQGGGNRNSATAPTEVTNAVRGNYFDPLSVDGSPTQAAPGGGGNAGGGGGNAGGGGNQGGGNQGGQGGQGGGFGVPLPTAKSGLVVMRGTRETLDTIQALIQKIDKPPKQVAMKLSIWQVSSTPQEVWGLLSLYGQKDRITAPYELGSLNITIDQKGGTALPENYSAAFEFLQQSRKARLLTQTEIAVVDGFNASISSTQTRGQLGTTAIIDQNGNVTWVPAFTSVDAGIDFDFTPQIDDRGRITLDLNTSITSFDGPPQRAIVQGTDVTFQPTVSTDVTTVIRVSDGQSMLIGGLVTKEDSESFSGLPFISKLPIIGKFFGRNEHQTNESYIFMTLEPNIIDDK